MCSSDNVYHLSWILKEWANSYPRIHTHTLNSETALCSEQTFRHMICKIKQIKLRRNFGNNLITRFRPVSVLQCIHCNLMLRQALLDLPILRNEFVQYEIVEEIDKLYFSKIYFLLFTCENCNFLNIHVEPSKCPLSNGISKCVKYHCWHFLIALSAAWKY